MFTDDTETVPPDEAALPERLYKAFHAKDRVERLRIRLAGGFTRAPAYALLADVLYDGDNGTEIVLLFHFLTVTVSGCNLQKLASALEKGTADFMQEYDRNRWKKPDDTKEPFIGAIEIVTQSLVPKTQQPEGDVASQNAPHSQ